MRDSADNAPISDAEAAALFGALSAVPALVLAVSGGPDSTALLWLAARWRDRLKNPPRLIAVTIDHGLRKESARDARAVAALARKVEVEHRTLRWTGRKPKTGIQEAAREARYRLLAVAARSAGAAHILTAHTLDDQAETVLFRLARGSGVSGLAGMGMVAGVPVAQGREIWLVRPLLALAKARLIATLDAAKVAYGLDPTNADPRFARPRLRTLLPVLAREGLTAERLGRLARRVARVDEVLFRTVNAAQAALCPTPWRAEGPVTIDTQAFCDLPAEIGIRLLARMIAHAGSEGTPGLGQLEVLHADVTQACRAGARRFRRTLGGALIELSNNAVAVERAPPRRHTSKPRGAGVEKGTKRRKGAFTKAR